MYACAATVFSLFFIARVFQRSFSYYRFGFFLLLIINLYAALCKPFSKWTLTSCFLPVFGAETNQSQNKQTNIRTKWMQNTAERIRIYSWAPKAPEKYFCMNWFAIVMTTTLQCCNRKKKKKKPTASRAYTYKSIKINIKPRIIASQKKRESKQQQQKHSLTKERE